MSPRSDFACAYAWIVPSITQEMGAVTLRVIEPAPRLGKLLSGHGLAGE
jgi:hypothetical protein